MIMNCILFAGPRVPGGMWHAEAKLIGEFIQQLLQESAFPRPRGATEHQGTRAMMNHG